MRLHSRKLRLQWKISMFNRRYIFKWLVFHCHASFLEDTRPATPSSWPVPSQVLPIGFLHLDRISPKNPTTWGPLRWSYDPQKIVWNKPSYYFIRPVIGVVITPFIAGSGAHESHHPRNSMMSPFFFTWLIIVTAHSPGRLLAAQQASLSSGCKQLGESHFCGERQHQNCDPLTNY